MINYKNIIFDLGGVVLSIDYRKTVEAFRNLGIEDPEHVYSKSGQISLFDDFEKGEISEDRFYDSMRVLSKKDLTDQQIRDAWNAMLIGLPQQNVDFLTELKKRHRLFLLSNTNAIHEKAYTHIIKEQYGENMLEYLFEKIYLSHHLHLRKPHPEIFNYVLSDSQLKKSETCFIDDSNQHVEGAKKTGLDAFHMKQGDLRSFFESIGIANQFS